MMPQIDWKYILALLAALLGSIVPIWLWQADLASKALTLTLVSTTELQSPSASGIDGLQILFKGQSLERPHVSVLGLTNIGSKPIVVADFEESVRITVAAPSSIVQARVQDAVPVELNPSISITEGAIRLTPLLLNPRDIIHTVALTSGASPDFTARARIAGVTSVEVNNAQSNRVARRYWLSLALAPLLFAGYVLLALMTMRSLRQRRFSFLFVTAALVCLSAAVLLLLGIQPDNQKAIAQYWWLSALGAVIALATDFLVWRPRSAA